MCKWYTVWNITLQILLTCIILTMVYIKFTISCLCSCHCHTFTCLYVCVSNVSFCFTRTISLFLHHIISIIAYWDISNSGPCKCSFDQTVRGRGYQLLNFPSGDLWDCLEAGMAEKMRVLFIPLSFFFSFAAIWLCCVDGFNRLYQSIVAPKAKLTAGTDRHAVREE